MIVGNDNIKTWFKAQKRPNWRLKKSSNSDVIANSQLDDPSIDEGLQELENTFNYVAPGQYFLECWEKGDRKNWTRSTVQIDGTAGKNYQSGIGGMYSPEDVQAQIQKGIEDYKRNEETEAMKRRLAELEAEKDSIQFQLLKRLTPYIDVIGKLTVDLLKGNPTPGIGSTKKKVVNEPENIKQMDDEKLLKQASEALNIWYEADPDAVELMVRIAKLATENPTMYQQAKNLLMGM